MNSPVDLPDIRNITISGRIASGATTLAHHVADSLGWEILDGGKLVQLPLRILLHLNGYYL